MNEMIAGILSQPLPPEPTPLTSLPPTNPTPAATPAASSGASTNGSTASATGPQKTTTTTTTTPKPAPAGGTKPKNNYRP